MEKQELSEIRQARPDLSRRERKNRDSDPLPIFGEHIWLNMLGAGAVVGLACILVGLRIRRGGRRRDS